MKRMLPYGLHFLLWSGAAVVLFCCYPHLLARQEANDFFQWSVPFFHEQLGHAPGLTSWLSAYLYQYFRWPLLGALFIATLALLTAMLVCRILKRKCPMPVSTVFGLAVPLALLVVSPFDLRVFLFAFFFFAFLYAGLSINSLKGRVAYMLIISVLGCFFVTWPMVVLLITILTLQACLGRRIHGHLLLGAVVCVGVSVVMVEFMKDKIAFIPFGQRYFYSPVSAMSAWLFYALFVVAVLPLFLHVQVKRRVTEWAVTGVGVLMVGVCLALMLKNQENNYAERTYRYVSMAESRQWEQLLASIPQEDVYKDRIAMAYALMAEVQLGTLPEHLFQYPIGNPEDLLFRYGMSAFECTFNHQFYENLGIYDEAYRQAFEYGVMCPAGTSFWAIRKQVDDAMQAGDWKVAQKYLDILDASSFHSQWVAKRRKALENHTDFEEEKPLVSERFINFYSFSSEMIHQLRARPTHRKLLDYALCALLLERKVDKWAVTMQEFPFYRDKFLPRAYAEAAAMVVSSPMSETMKDFRVPPEAEQQFSQFYYAHTQSKNPTDLIKFQGSLWYYFHIVPKQAPAIGAMEGQQHAIN